MTFLNNVLNFVSESIADGSQCVPRACDPGNAFDENLKACANINECEGENTCHASAVCEDKVPLSGQSEIFDFYSCTCPPATIDQNPENPGRDCLSKCDEGFSYDQTTDSCFDIDECLLGTHTCVENSQCFNTVGFIDGNSGFDCICKSGFSGDGLVECKDIDECEDNFGISPCASCTLENDNRAGFRLYCIYYLILYKFVVFRDLTYKFSC